MLFRSMCVAFVLAGLMRVANSARVEGKVDSANTDLYAHDREIKEVLRHKRTLSLGTSDRTVTMFHLRPSGLHIETGLARDLVAGNPSLAEVQVNANEPIPTFIGTVPFDASGFLERSRIKNPTYDGPTEFTTCVGDAGVGKNMALTFDDGPRTLCTTQLLDILNANGAKSTFFQLGHAWGTNCVDPSNFHFCEDVWNSMLKNGHTIGYHSWNHNDIPNEPMELLPARTAQAQLGFARANGHHPILYRPPNGVTGFGTDAYNYFKSLNYKFVNWNLHTEDWTYVGKYKPGDPAIHGIVDAFRSRLEDGTVPLVSLMHDTDSFEWLDLVPEILSLVMKNGYTFVNMETCLGLPADQVYADQGLSYKQASKGSNGPECEGEWNLWKGPAHKTDLFKQPICLKKGVCEDLWEYQLNEHGECIQLESTKEVRYDWCRDYGEDQWKKKEKAI